MGQMQVRSFADPDEARTPPKARIEVVNVGGTTLARGTMEPGWRWSESVKPIAGTDSCQFNHVGTVVSGRMHVRLDDGSEHEIGPGDVFDIPPGHDAWVVGDEPYVSLHFLGADEYAD